MMKKGTYLLIGILVAFVFCVHPGTASALGFEAGIGYWQQSPSGDISYKPLSDSDRLDIEEDFNYDKKNRPYARLKLDLPLFLPNVYLMYTPMKFDGDGNINRTFRFGDETFNANIPFYSKLELNQYDIALYYGIPFLNTATIGKLNAEFGLNVKIIDFSAEVRQETTNTSESESLTIPVPMIYVAAQLKPIKAFSVEVEGRGIAYSGNHYYDFIGRVKVKPIGPVFISGGYRFQDIKIDESDVEAKFKFAGPFLELGVEI